MAIGNAAAPAAQGAQAAGGQGVDQAGAEAQMQKTFQDAVAQNAAITKIQTEGNTAKRAAAAAPQ